MRRVDPAEAEWLCENYARGTIYDTLDAFEAEFGYRPSKGTLYQRACKMGLAKDRQDVRIRTGVAERRVDWSEEPEMEAWMLAHDKGRMQDTVEAFEAEFGFRLSRGQISLFRAQHGTQLRRRRYGRGRKPLPVGAERERKGGIFVKVAPEPTVPMSKDNWRYKHIIAYEEAYGPVPEGHAVYAVDGDRRNCDPANLVAIDKRVAGVIANMRGQGLEWSTRGELLAVAAVAALKVAEGEAKDRMGTVCSVCGRMFQRPEAYRRSGYRPRTCPECREMGRIAPKRR